MNERPPKGASHQRREPAVVDALQPRESHGMLDPWGIDDIVVDGVVSELRAIRSRLESGQLPSGDGPEVRSLTGLLEEIELMKLVRTLVVHATAGAVVAPLGDR